MKSIDGDAPLNQLHFKGMGAHVADTLGKAIFDGVFEPGELLQDTVLEQKLSMSRGPVWQVLHPV